MDTQDPPTDPAISLLGAKSFRQRKRCYDVTLSRQEGSTTRHLASAQHWAGLAGGDTGRLFLTFGGPVRADRISYCPLDRVLTYKNLIYLLNLQFYCEKYTYHFLTIAICWCHPTHWPTLRNVLRNLKRPVSECELACPPSGHVTTLVNNLHYFCWPS